MLPTDLSAGPTAANLPAKLQGISQAQLTQPTGQNRTHFPNLNCSPHPPDKTRHFSESRKRTEPNKTGHISTKPWLDIRHRSIHPVIPTSFPQRNSGRNSTPPRLRSELIS